MVTDAPVSNGIMESLNGNIADRRTRKRVVAQWPVRMWKGRQPICNAFTINVSSSGFFCCSRQPFSPGDSLTALLEIPSPGSDLESQKLTLRCEIIVLRVEALEDVRNTGMACQIIEYSVLKSASTITDLTSAHANWAS